MRQGKKNAQLKKKMVHHTLKQKAELKRIKQRSGACKVRRRERRNADPSIAAKRVIYDDIRKAAVLNVADEMAQEFVDGASEIPGVPVGILSVIEDIKAMVDTLHANKGYGPHTIVTPEGTTTRQADGSYITEPFVKEG